MCVCVCGRAVCQSSLKSPRLRHWMGFNRMFGLLTPRHGVNREDSSYVRTFFRVKVWKKIVFDVLVHCT